MRVNSRPRRSMKPVIRLGVVEYNTERQVKKKKTISSMKLARSSLSQLFIKSNQSRHSGFVESSGELDVEMPTVVKVQKGKKKKTKKVEKSENEESSKSDAETIPAKQLKNTKTKSSRDSPKAKPKRRHSSKLVKVLPTEKSEQSASEVVIEDVKKTSHPKTKKRLSGVRKKKSLFLNESSTRKGRGVAKKKASTKKTRQISRRSARKSNEKLAVEVEKLSKSRGRPRKVVEDSKPSQLSDSFRIESKESKTRKKIVKKLPSSDELSSHRNPRRSTSKKESKKRISTIKKSSKISKPKFQSQKKSLMDEKSSKKQTKEDLRKSVSEDDMNNSSIERLAKLKTGKSVRSNKSVKV